MAAIHPDALAAFLRGDHGAPQDILGPHPLDEARLSVRAFFPNASAVTLIDEKTGERWPMTCLDGAGFYEVRVNRVWPGFRYVFGVQQAGAGEERRHDPYAYPPLFTDYDLYLWNKGRLLYSYEKLGAHVREINGVRGVNFAVWAPNAYQVSVIGGFNGWDTRVHGMQQHEASGVWEVFVPEARVGEIYRFALRSQHNNYRVEKTDPYGFYYEQRPSNASIVTDLDRYVWHDDDWMQGRRARDPLKTPMSIYEVHLGSWRRGKDGGWLGYRELAHALVDYARAMGYTHIELMPVAEHALDESWGYLTTGYYAPTSRFGDPADFMYFVDYCHQYGIGVILDWVSAHFPKDAFALSYFDGTHLYEHADPRQAEHPDWGTLIFNYGRTEVRNFLISNALFWLKQYHLDGLRVDAVSSMLYLDFSRKAGEWIPNQYGGNENLDAIAFLREMNEIVHRECPGAMTIAEESTSWPMVSRPVYLGGLGFTLKWNMGWMHDTLNFMQLDPLYRRYAHNQITFSMAYAFSENFVLSISHDEVVHGKGSLMQKMAGDHWQKFASLRVLFGYQYTHPGKKLLFMGQEFGQWREWSETASLQWDLLGWPLHRALQAWVRDLNSLLREQPSLYEHDFDWKGFRWVEANDAEQSVISYIRFADDEADFLVVLCNFTPLPRYNYRVGVPAAGLYQEILNSDSSLYGGSNVGNGGSITSQAVPWHSWDQSLSLTLPPLAILVLKPVSRPK